jgi:hypothetical protein
MRRVLTSYFFAFIFLISSGQVEKQLLPSDLRQQTIVTEPLTLKKGYFRSGLALSYGVVDKYFDGVGGKKYHMNSAWGSSSFYLFSFQYGLSDRTMVDLSVPIRHSRHKYMDRKINPGTNSDIITSSKLAGNGIGDGLLAIKYQIIPGKPESSLSLSASLDITFPTGKKNPSEIRSVTEYNLPTGNGVFVAGGRLTARKVFYPYSLVTYTGYMYRFRGSKIISVADDAETVFKIGNSFETGASFNLHLNDWIVLTNEISFDYRGKGEIRYTANTMIDPAWTLSYETGLVFQVRQLRIKEAVRVPVRGKNISADPGYNLVVQYIF